MTKRERIAADYRAAIARGDLHPGDQLPVEAEVMAEYGVSRQTVRQAIATLSHEGVVVVEHGRGTFVAAPTRTAPITRHNPVRLSADERGAGRGAHLTDAVQRQSTVQTRVYFERADKQAAEMLGIPVGNEIVVRDRAMSLDGEVTQLAVSRLPRELVYGTPIEDEDPGSGGILARLEDLGYTLAAAIERVSLHRASMAEAATLGVTTGTHCFRVLRTQPDTNGQVLEMNTMTLIGRYELVYEVPTR